MNQQSGTPAAAPKNGMGVTALVLGIIGICLAWIPIIGFLGFILGALAIIFGIIAVVRSHKGTATNMVVSYIGLVTGVIAFIVSIVVFVVLVNQMDKHFNERNWGPGADQSSSPSRSDQDGSGSGGDQGDLQVLAENTSNGQYAVVSCNTGF